MTKRPELSDLAHAILREIQTVHVLLLATSEIKSASPHCLGSASRYSVFYQSKHVHRGHSREQFAPGQPALVKSCSTIPRKMAFQAKII